ncbi:hypothetical protein ACWF0M_25965 [Kribbella sp. NPDC055110]
MSYAEYGARGGAGAVLEGGIDRADERLLQAVLAVQVAGVEIISRSRARSSSRSFVVARSRMARTVRPMRSVSDPVAGSTVSVVAVSSESASGFDSAVASGVGWGVD